MSEKSKETVTEKKVSRRSMLKWTGALAAAAVVGAVAEYGITESTKPPPPPPISFKPPLSPEVQQRADSIKKQLIARHEGEQIFYTNCAQNGCRSATCVLKMHVKDGVVTAIEPDDTINPNVPIEDFDAVAKMMIQNRPCAMGHAWRKDLYSPTRIIYPMKLVGQRGDFPPNFIRISWQEALDAISNWIKTAKDKYGPLSVLWSTWVQENMPTRWYDMGFQITGNTSGGAHLSASEWMMGWLRMSLKPYVPQIKPTPPTGRAGADTLDILNSKSIVLWGWSPLNSYTGTHNYMYLVAKEKGIPVFVIDPRDSMTADTMADQWIPIRPNTDTAMLLAMANVLFKDDSYDKGFVDKYVEPTGFQKWKDYILGVTEGPDGKIDRTPEWAEKICGVPADTIRELARFLAKNRPARIILGLAPARLQLGENMARAGICLQAMLGSIGVPGGYVSSPQTGGPAARITRPSFSLGQKPAKYVAPIVMDDDKFAEAILAREELDQGKITEAQFKTRIGCAEEEPAPNIKAIFVHTGNYVNQACDVNKRARAFKKADYTAMLGSQNDINMATARYCDILIPLTNLFFEEPFGRMRGGGTGSRWLSAGWENNYIMLIQSAAKWNGESRPDIWFCVELAKRLGVVDDYAPALKNVAPEDYNKFADTLNKEAYEKWAAQDNVKATLGFTPPTWEEFIKNPIIRMPLDITKTYSAQATNGVMFNLAEQTQGGQTFATKSGKIEFYSDFLATTDLSKTIWGIGPMAPMAQWVVPGSNYAPPEEVEGAPSGDSFWDPNVKNFPLYFTMPAAVYRQHSLHDNNPWLNDQYRHAMWISVPDAKARGIVDNDLVRIYNDVGEIVLPAYVTSRILPGVVAIHSGGWYTPNQVKTSLMPDGIDRRGCMNILTHDYLFPGLSTGSASLVQVQKFQGAT